MSGYKAEGYDQTEAEDIRDILIKLPKLKNTEFILETEATNTKENVVYGLAKLSDTPTELTFVFKSHVSRRGLATLRSSLPSAAITQFTYPVDYSEAKLLTRENWTGTNAGKARVWGEFLRLLKFHLKGDILLTEQELNLVDQIINKIK